MSCNIHLKRVFCFSLLECWVGLSWPKSSQEIDAFCFWKKRFISIFDFPPVFLHLIPRLSCLKWHPDKNADKVEVATEVGRLAPKRCEIPTSGWKIPTMNERCVCVFPIEKWRIFPLSGSAGVSVAPIKETLVSRVKAIQLEEDTCKDISSYRTCLHVDGA